MVEYVTYGAFEVLKSRSERHSIDDDRSAFARGGVLLGAALSGDGYATFGTGSGVEAVLVIARGDGESARRALKDAGVLLWSPPARETTQARCDRVTQKCDPAV